MPTRKSATEHCVNGGSKRPLLLVCGDLHNLGDLALTLQNLDVAQSQGRTAYVRRWAPLPASIEAQVQAAGGRLIDGRIPTTLLALAWRADMVIGGGQLVRENVSLKALTLLFAAACLVRLGGGTVATRGLGVGRVRGRLPHLLWRGVLRLCQRVNVRDVASARNTALLVPAHRVALTADMAFLPTSLHRRLERGGTSSSNLVVAPCRDGSEGRSLDGPGFASVLTAARASLPESRLVFACHDPRPGMDGAAADAIAKAYALNAERALSYHLDDLFAVYASAGLVITNRLHSLVFSLLAERPVLVIDDGTHKTAAMAEAFGLTVVDNARPYTSVEASSLINRALQPDKATWRRRKHELANLARHNLDD